MVLHIISTNGMAKIAIQPNGSTMERRISFSTIEDCKAAIARASNAGIFPRDTRLHRAFADDYWEETKCFSKTVPTWQPGKPHYRYRLLTGPLRGAKAVAVN
jgi:hypothetical protein